MKYSYGWFRLKKLIIIGTDQNKIYNMDTPSIGIENNSTGVNSAGTGDVNSRFEKSLGLLTTR